MLALEDIHTFYGETEVLFGVSLEVAEGEVVALLGPNGAGKTTTLRSVLGLSPARAGRIRFDGRDISRAPTLSRFAAEGREEELNATLLGALRAGATLAFLGAVGAFVFAGPLVHVVYEGRAFTPDDTARVAGLLEIFAFAVPAWIVQQIAVRGFYARGDTWRPMWLGTVIAALAVVLYFWLGSQYGARGLALAGVIGMSINAGGTLLLLRALHGGPSLDALARSGARAVAIAGVAGAVAFVLPSFGPGLAGALLDLGVGGAVFAALALFGVHTAGDEAQRGAIAAVTRRLRRRRNA
jgi:peptidoglycan biosynthesis protein MviN/MurJ (putative lipid II flippase)